MRLAPNLNSSSKIQKEIKHIERNISNCDDQGLIKGMRIYINELKKEL